jgi:hypothetical protein
LKQIVPDSHKPFVLVKGEPLLVRTIVQCQKAGVKDIIVVLAPRNAQSAVDLLEANDLLTNTHLVLQPTPIGPGEALMRGLAAVPSECHDVIILVGDNVYPSDIIHHLTHESYAARSSGVVIGEYVTHDVVSRRTYWSTTHREWREHTSIPPNESKRMFTWQGPLMMPVAKLRLALLAAREAIPMPYEWPIGPAFNYLSNDGPHRLSWSGIEDVGQPTS